MRKLYFLIVLITIIHSLFTSNNIFGQGFIESDIDGFTGVVGGSISWGDYDIDGNLDFIIIGQDGSGKITKIFQNNGDNSFTENTNIDLTDVAYGSVAWGDYNNDGLLDILLSGFMGNPITKVYRNDGNDNFIDIGAYIIGVWKSSVMWLDVNNDGYLDIIVAGQTTSQDNICKVYINQKDDNFQESDNFINGVSRGSIDQWDINNDSYTDLLLCGRDYSGNPYLGIYLNDGYGKFYESGIKFDGIADGSAKWVDYDNDGRADILVTGVSRDKYVSILYRNMGNMIFEKMNFDFPIGEFSVFDVADYDNDGDKDVIFSGYSHDTFLPYVKLYQNNLENFDEINESLIQLRRGVVSWCDMNNDNMNDLFIAGEILQDSLGLRLYSNNLNVTNVSPTIPNGLSSKIKQNLVELSWNKSTDVETPQGGITYNLRVGTQPFGSDILSANYNNSIGKRIINNYGNVFNDTTWIIKNLEPGTYYWSVQAIDQSNRYSDFSEQDTIYVSNLFTEVSTNFPEISDGKVSFIDINNDNNLDVSIVGINQSPTEPTDTVIKIYLNYNNEFQEINFQNDYKIGTNIIWDDFNNDGYIDFLSSNENLYLFLNDQNGNFLMPDSSIFKINDTNYFSLDYDKDGDKDIVATNFICLNDGTGRFIVKSINLPGILKFTIDIDLDFNDEYILSSENYLFIYDYANNAIMDTISDNLGSLASTDKCDFDNDGDLDFLICGSDINLNTYTRIYENKAEKFTFRKDLNLRGFADGAIRWFDYNNDGFSDFLISGYSGTYKAKIFQNSDYSFKELNEAYTAFHTYDIGDIDKDGDLDILPGGNAVCSGCESIVFINNSNWPNDPPTAPANLHTQCNGYGIIFGWDEATDPQSTEGGLSYNLRVGTTPGGVDIVSPMSDVVTGYRRIPKMGNCQMNLGWRLDTLPEGTYYWSVQAIDQSFMGGEWTEEQTFTISVVRADFDADTVCLGTETTFTDQTLTSGDPITEWKWNFGDDSTSTLQNPTHTYATADTFSVQLIAISSEYSDTITQNVIVKPKPGVGFIVDAVCHGEPSVFTNQTDEQGLTITSWNWEFGDNQTTNQRDPDPHYYAQPGEYTAKLAVHSGNGCFDTLSKPVIVAKYPVVIVSANGPVEFCEGDDVLLSVEENADYHYQWKLDEVALSDSTNYHCHAIFKGEYSVDVENTLAGCLSSSSPVNINVVEKPVKPTVNLNGYNPDDCPESSLITMEVTESTTLYDYQWKRNGVPLSGENNAKLEMYLKEGLYTVDVANGDCKTTSDEIDIDFNYELPKKPRIEAKGPTVWYLACTNDTADQYKWYYNDELIDDAVDYIHVADQNLGIYKVSINMDGNCWVTSDEITIPLTATGIEDADPFTNLKIYPNPTPGVFTIEMDNNLYGELITRIFKQNAVEIFNIKYDKTTRHFKAQVDLSGQGSGIYFILLSLDTFKVNRKIVIE